MGQRTTCGISVDCIDWFVSTASIAKFRNSGILSFNSLFCFLLFLFLAEAWLFYKSQDLFANSLYFSFVCFLPHYNNITTTIQYFCIQLVSINVAAVVQFFTLKFSPGISFFHVQRPLNWAFHASQRLNHGNISEDFQARGSVANTHARRPAAFFIYGQRRWTLLYRILAK